MIEFNPVQTNELPWKEKIVQRLWEFARPMLFGWSPWFARHWRLFILRNVSKIVGQMFCSNSASFSRKSRIDYPWRLSIGDRSSIGDGVWVYCLDKIAIGKNCCICEDVRLITGAHDIYSPMFTLITKPITINDNVWIATGAIILPGVTIGEGAVVAAGAVVTKDVEPWTIVGGGPQGSLLSAS